ncbi:hypothetical protein LIT25_21325 [Bacillus sp. F19]|nr:hypothetical protein LIT25_21325 [Bacillus sp. F19]
MTNNKGFIFLGDRIKLLMEEQEVQLIQDYYLKKANRQQVEFIKNTTGNISFFSMNYELIKGEEDDNVRYYHTENFEDWNYWIVEHNESQSRFNIKLALLLSTSDLFSLFEKLPKLVSMYQQFSYSNFIAENTTRANYEFKEISQTNIIEIQDIYNLLEQFNKVEYTYIAKALDDYYQLRNIPNQSPFYILGMFSILEALLVHKGQVSITHQIKTKLNLLNNRFEDPINFSEFFGDVRYEKVIAKLYEYRSDIAHGDFADFNGDLKVLVKFDHVSKVIHKILKTTLKQALKEPQLFKDLKNC